MPTPLGDDELEQQLAAQVAQVLDRRRQPPTQRRAARLVAASTVRLPPAMPGSSATARDQSAVCKLVE